MRQSLLVACLVGLVVAWMVPASAMPVAKSNDLGVSTDTVLVHGHGHHLRECDTLAVANQEHSMAHGPQR